MSKKWKFTGIRNLEKQFEKKLKNIDKASTDGLLKAANHLLDLSQPLVPVDTGQLKSSGKVVQENKNTVYVTYEAYNPENGYEYAPIVHENLSFKHPIHYHGKGKGHGGIYDCGGQAKYLEEPFMTNIDNLIDIVASSVEKGIDK